MSKVTCGSKSREIFWEFFSLNLKTDQYENHYNFFLLTSHNMINFMFRTMEERSKSTAKCQSNSQICLPKFIFL